MFDSCEKATPEARSWLWDLFLALAHPERTPGLVVVVSGQELPDPSGEWEDCCRRLPLAGLEPDHWWEYAQRLKLPLSEETVRAFHVRFAGLPYEMANTLGLFATGGGGL